MPLDINSYGHGVIEKWRTWESHWRVSENLEFEPSLPIAQGNILIASPDLPCWSNGNKLLDKLLKHWMKLN